MYWAHLWAFCRRNSLLLLQKTVNTTRPTNSSTIKEPFFFKYTCNFFTILGITSLEYNRKGDSPFRREWCYKNKFELCTVYHCTEMHLHQSNENCAFKQLGITSVQDSCLSPYHDYEIFIKADIPHQFSNFPPVTKWSRVNSLCCADQMLSGI